MVLFRDGEFVVIYVDLFCGGVGCLLVFVDMIIAAKLLSTCCYGHLWLFFLLGYIFSPLMSRYSVELIP